MIVLWCFLSFFAGSIFGVAVMALMLAVRNDD